MNREEAFRAFAAMQGFGIHSDQEGLPVRDLTALHRQALDWLALTASGNATAADLAAMKKWRAVCPENEDAFRLATTMAQFVRTQPLPTSEGLKAPWFERPTTRRMALAGMGVAVAAYSVVRPPMGVWPSLAELTSDYRTQTGEQKSVALARGVSLQLNTGTSIGVRHDRANPGIRLIEGEVAVSARLPQDGLFSLHAPTGSVVARDATFDVRIVDAGFRTICLDGAVTVQSGNRQVPLTAGQAVTCSTGASAPGKPYSVDLTVATAWRRGQLVFYDAPLRDVVAEINRYRPGRIVVVGSRIGGRRINASFSIRQLDNTAQNLARFAGVSATTLPGGIVLLT